jgi:Glycosyl hydrolase family 36 C-terminal domain
LRLRGIDPGARYLDVGSGREHRGSELMQQGLRLPAYADLDFGSAPVGLARSSGPG